MIHLEGFPEVGAQAACRRADYFANYTSPGIRRILVRALDLEPLPVSTPVHGQLNEPRFARPAATFVATTQENVLEPH